MTKTTFDFILERIINNAMDAANEKGGDDTFQDGKKLAYYEILDTIKNEIIAHDIDVSEYGLDTALEDLM